MVQERVYRSRTDFILDNISWRDMNMLEKVIVSAIYTFSSPLMVPLNYLYANSKLRYSDEKKGFVIRESSSETS